jgi:DNA-binding NarL/FixJ family response regulator
MDRAVVGVVIIDDHEVVVRGIVAWCRESDPPIDVLAVGDHVDVAFGVRATAADVVILDLQLIPGEPDLGGLQRLVDAGRQVVIYTHVLRGPTAVRCIDLGALSYVTKAEAGEHLIAAVRAAATGSAYTPPGLGGALATDDNPRRPRLSAQELAALRAWFSSRSKRVAAESLHVRTTTLDTYIERARVKYAAVGRAAPTKTALVQRAVEDGLVQLTELGPLGE